MKDELLFCPLGGSGEIGMNMNLFGYGQPSNHKWIMVDIGVTFADDTVPGIDLIYPDPGFIVDKKDSLLGIVLTHAHEDHIGAISHIWPKLKCNIYATPFTAALVTEKFKEKKIDIHPFLKIVNLRGNIKLGPFDIELITMTHSILEPNGLKIKTPLGCVLHTGDWKCDPNPLIGDVIDSKKLKSIGDEGVLAMICDSTNIFSMGRSGSEIDVRKNLLKIFERLKKKIIRKYRNELMNRFLNQIKSLTRKEGVILCKLIYRKNNITVFSLIRKYRGSWNAFWWQRLSKIYEGDLKSSFYPKKNKEDFLIEKVIEDNFLL